MKNIRLSELFTRTKPTGVSVKAPLALTTSTTETLSSDNIVVNRDVIEPFQTTEYLPIITKTVSNTLNKKKSIDEDSKTSILAKVSNFNIIGNIELQGDYPQNIVNFPKFILNTNIKTLPDINFRFILSIKRNSLDSNPILYTSDKFYNELASSYWENNPYMVANAIKSEAIITIVYDEYVSRLEEYKTLELNVGKVGVLVGKNVFVNYTHTLESDNTDDSPSYTYNSTIDIDNLVRYIDWVVSKPAISYDERLLKATDIGAWSLKDGPSTSTPENQTGTPSTPPSNEPPITQPTYPPVGRAGFYQNEEVRVTNGLYKWTNTVGFTAAAGGNWELIEDTTNQSGGGGGGS